MLIDELTQQGTVQKIIRGRGVVRKGPPPCYIFFLFAEERVGRAFTKHKLL